MSSPTYPANSAAPLGRQGREAPDPFLGLTAVRRGASLTGRSARRKRRSAFANEARLRFAAKATRARATRATDLRMSEVFLPSCQRMGLQHEEAGRHFGATMPDLSSASASQGRARLHQVEEQGQGIRALHPWKKCGGLTARNHSEGAWLKWPLFQTPPS